MSKYVEFTQEEIDRAAHTDIKSFLEAKGEKVLRSGSEWMWAANPSVKIRGHVFCEHATGEGGTAIDFLCTFYNCRFPDAVLTLLGEDYNGVRLHRNTAPPPERKPFKLPQKSRNMKRLYAYLMQERKIDPDIISFFVHQRSLYESSNTHNAVFVGYDRIGKARSAHEKGTLSDRPYRRDVPGSSKDYFFNYSGGSEWLFVFEAPIDLMSFICLHKDKNWKKHNYLALGGLSDRALARFLSEYSNIRKIVFCLDNDANAKNKDGSPAPNHGQVAARQFCHDYGQKGYDTCVMVPDLKDWNEVQKSRSQQ
ncbi:DUF3991 domain-containing protein [Caproiciproducens sp. LBM24188]